MPIKVEFGGIELTGDVQGQRAHALRPDPTSVRIGVIGDFRGRGTRGAAGPGKTMEFGPARLVDRDNFDSVLARFGAELALTFSADPNTPVVLKFDQVDDFHPDRILATAKVFDALGASRRRLQDPATFAAAAAELGVKPGATGSARTPVPPAAALPPSELLDLIVGQTAESSRSETAGAPGSGAWRAFLEQVAAPYVRIENPKEAELVAGVDEAMAHLLREILHHPRFQAIESLWRSVHLLTRRLETGRRLTLELIDATRAELEADLVSSAPIESTRVFKLLVEPSVGTEGGRPWSLLVGDLTFEPSQRDIALLWRIGQIARLAGAPFLAAASSRFIGCESLAANPDPDEWSPSPAVDAWTTLRRSEEAPYLALALPRVLVRASYGPESNSIETFAFTESPGAPVHESYLWGNPAFAVALLIASCFDGAGRFDPAQINPELSELPLALESSEDGETRAKPCAEVLLGRRAAERISDAGLIPLLSVRDRGAIRLAQIASIAEPAAMLSIR
jgi:type VI secretion system protein ImpC